MFEGAAFRGTFRSYQQRILDNADKYLSDGRINVVAAPGSGKTVLGLELILRLAKPCIILSPTTTIRDQWGQRFIENFMPDGAEPSKYVSFDFNNCAKITSVTYQALYSAVEKVRCAEGEEQIDYSELDIFKAVRELGIGTICLDEAHHLQNEWQRALEKFLEELKGEVKIIALTATPPYDANAGEWKRYLSVCGEIDEEIFVPELVKQGTLCPHQDYVWFNYPSENEISEFDDYSERVKEALKELKICPEFSEALINLTYREADLNGWLDGKYAEMRALLSLGKSLNIKTDKEILKWVRLKNQVKPDVAEIELALNFLISEEKLLDENKRGKIAFIFKERQLFERGKIVITLNDKLKKKLISSSGKLSSIAEITRLESRQLNEGLRLLVLCDFIRKESLSDIGKDKKFDEVNIVSVFETLRKNCPYGCGAVSGSLVLLPVRCAETLAYMGVNCNFKPIENTEYAEFNIRGGNKEKVAAVGALFERGEICALVGTKSLLGEGWDSPCINTLILASFVGSFMLSNQMRGRAIRTDKNNPEKVADIWHLVTVEPQKNGETDAEKFYDFELLSRRFACFVAPSYSTDRIENGIARLTVIEPPFDKKGVERINKKMAELAKEREGLKSKWESSLAISSEMYQAGKVPEEMRFPTFTFFNFARLGLLCSLMGIAIFAICFAFFNFTTAAVHWSVGIIGAIIIFIALDRVFNIFLNRLLKHRNPEKSIYALTDCMLKTMRECGIISSDCRVAVNSDDIGNVINVKLDGAVMREQKLFTSAVADLFSPIESPRYVLIPKYGKVYRYKCALACPSVLGTKQENVRLFADNLKKTLGKMEIVYTRSTKGNAFLKRCRRKAYITENNRIVEETFGNY